MRLFRLIVRQGASPGLLRYMGRRIFICLMALWSLTLPAWASAPDSVEYSYEFSGVFTWGEVITSLCRDGFCRTQLPRDFFELRVPLNVYERSFDDAFKALSMQARADGYLLKKTGKKRPYTVIVELDQESQASYISCLDTMVRSVPSVDLYRYKLADSLKCASRVASEAFLRDSLARVRDSIFHPSVRYRVAFYVVSSSYLHHIGVQWTRLWAEGTLAKRPDLITDWALQAVSQDDTTAEFRSIEVDLDSSTTLHWGSQKKEEKSTVVYNNGVSQNDYEWRDYGLTLTLVKDTKLGVKADYQLAQRDENNSILKGSFGGGGKDSISAWGVYDSYQNSFSGIPLLYHLPFIGYLFGHETRDKVKSFFVIEVYPVNRDTTNFPVLDSLKKEDVIRYEDIEPDSTDGQPDSLDSSKDSVMTPAPHPPGRSGGFSPQAGGGGDLEAD